MCNAPRFSIKVLLAGILLAALGSYAFASKRERTLYDFLGGDNGNQPQTGVVFDGQGNIYGTTYYGGSYGWGTVFSLEPTSHGWKQKVLYSFLGSSDGFNPVGNLLIDANGNLYGTTLYGGTGVGCTPGSYDCGGTVFALKAENGIWKHEVLYSFCSVSGCADGAAPYGLAFDKAGNLIGSTDAGGTSCEYGCGTVYKLTRSKQGWTEKVLHQFSTEGDGYYPGLGGVSLDASGNIYGTTYAGGATGYGIVFELKPGKHGWNELVLYNFTGSGNEDPTSGLTLDGKGNIYGTTLGGTNTCSDSPCGAIFELTYSHHQWNETIIHEFEGSDGDYPNPNLVLGKGETLYGTTLFGGKYGYGVAYRMQHKKGWEIGVLHSFGGVGDGADPMAGLIFGLHGNLYGTTSSFYDSQYEGSVFEIVP
jgi:uncharacterized repeat protein (TIGR03803 family)